MPPDLSGGPCRGCVVGGFALLAALLAALLRGAARALGWLPG